MLDLSTTSWMVKSLSSRSPSSSIAAETKRSLRAWARARALRSDRSTLSLCQPGTCGSAGCRFFFAFSSVDRAMTLRSLKVDFGQEVTDDSPDGIRALLMGRMRRASDFYKPGPRIDLREPLALL